MPRTIELSTLAAESRGKQMTQRTTVHASLRVQYAGRDVRRLDVCNGKLTRTAYLWAKATRYGSGRRQ